LQRSFTKNVMAIGCNCDFDFNRNRNRFDKEFELQKWIQWTFLRKLFVL
jgi:hypothetical protein